MPACPLAHLPICAPNSPALVQGDHAPLEELRTLFAAPYDEHPHLEERYYCRTPQEQLQKGGISFFS